MVHYLIRDASQFQEKSFLGYFVVKQSLEAESLLRKRIVPKETSRFMVANEVTVGLEVLLVNFEGQISIVFNRYSRIVFDLDFEDLSGPLLFDLNSQYLWIFFLEANTLEFETVHFSGFHLHAGRPQVACQRGLLLRVTVKVEHLVDGL